MDIEGKKKDGTLFRTRVCRTKSFSYVISLTGASLPDTEVASKIFGSFRLPKDVAGGKLTSYGPDAGKASYADGKLEAWTPVVLKDSDDFPDFSDDGGTGEGHAGEFGYTSYSIGIVKLPEGMEDRLDEESIDHLIHLKFDEDDEGNKVKWSEFKSIPFGAVSFRSATYSNDTLEGRVDVLVKDSKLYMFATAVPRGMLGSDDVKKFFESIKVK